MRQKPFKDKHKIQGYCNVEQVIPDLPMHRVQQESDMKLSVLHRNLLFSLVDQGGELNKVPVENSNVVSKLDVEDDTKAEMDYWPGNEEPYQCPITRSKTRALAKANVLLEEYSSVEQVHKIAVNEKNFTSTTLASVGKATAFVNCSITAAIEWFQ